MNAQAIGLRQPAVRRLLKNTVSSGGLLYVGFLALIVIFAFASPVFLTPENFANIGRQTTLVSIMAVGMAMVIICGEFDLSVEIGRAHV